MSRMVKVWMKLTDHGLQSRPSSVLANRIRLLRQNSTTKVLLVEGTSDVRVWRDAERRWKTWSGGCRDQVVQVLNELSGAELRTTGLVDRDFDWELQNAAPETVFCYPDRDLEMWMIGQFSIADLIEDMSATAQLSQFGGANLIAHRVIEDAQWVGRLRATNAVQDLRLPFSDLPLSGTTDKSSLRLKRIHYLDKLVSKRQGNSHPLPQGYQTSKEISDKLVNVDYSQFGPRGRDVISLISSVVHEIGRKAFRSMKVTGVAEIIESTTRASARPIVLKTPFASELLDRLVED